MAIKTKNVAVLYLMCILVFVVAFQFCKADSVGEVYKQCMKECDDKCKADGYGDIFYHGKCSVPCDAKQRQDNVNQYLQTRREEHYMICIYVRVLVFSICNKTMHCWKFWVKQEDENRNRKWCTPDFKALSILLDNKFLTVEGESSNSNLTAPSLQVMNQTLTRLERFDGHNFTRWQETVKFFLITIKLWYILEDGLDEIPAPSDKDTDDLKARRKKRQEDDFMCHGHILNALGTSVYNVHRSISSAKELWTTLENKYKISEASNKKFLICNFMDFKMVDSKSIIFRVSELLLIVNHLKDAGIELVSAFIVGVIISRLPPSWNGFKKT
ncbi:uncharacterized protein LOC113326661 isoform X2 [Papaver somniferum]|uniref:uncharacterized protein LOC113326661 isoform X2 n=1 Tax=Papaver somniferum TaxID=3469 RepID=UPI000E6FF808|nr:uncharacterized protein LOC113326661 isoform X2 [Papaver somniferum]